MFYLIIINGLIDSFNPCAFGVLIFYLTLLLSVKVERKLFISFGLFYISATYVTYFLIGLGILKVMHLFGVHDFFGWAATLLILFLGFVNLKDYFWPNWQIPYVSSFLNRCHLPKYKPEVTILSAVILGFLVGICEFPCSGGIYLATVSLLSVKATFWKGIAYLTLYNLMFILPLLVLFGTVGNKPFFSYLQKVHQKTFSAAKLIMGLSVLVSGILLLIWLIEKNI